MLKQQSDANVCSTAFAWVCLLPFICHDYEMNIRTMVIRCNPYSALATAIKNRASWANAAGIKAKTRRKLSHLFIHNVVINDDVYGCKYDIYIHTYTYTYIMYMGCVVMCYEAMLVRSCLVYGNFFNDLLTYIECSACVCVIILCLRCTSIGGQGSFVDERIPNTVHVGLHNSFCLLDPKGFKGQPLCYLWRSRCNAACLCEWELAWAKL